MTLPKENWWTPTQLALVEGRSRLWRLTSFEPSDALAFESGGQIAVCKRDADDDVSGPALVPGGWDHEHCELCWEKIFLIPGTNHSGYTDGREWLCVECYEKFIVPRTTRP